MGWGITFEGTSSAAPTELLSFSSVFPQGSVRAFGTLATLGYEEVLPLQGFIYAFTSNQLLCCFDAVVLLKKGIVLEVEKKHLSLHVGSLKFGVDG